MWRYHYCNVSFDGRSKIVKKIKVCIRAQWPIRPELIPVL